MKKLFATLFVVLFSMIIIVPEQTADAQPVVVSNRCCDAWNNVRCIQVNYTPVGSSCFCVGQGYGHTC